MIFRISHFVISIRKREALWHLSVVDNITGHRQQFRTPTKQGALSLALTVLEEQTLPEGQMMNFIRDFKSYS